MTVPIHAQLFFGGPAGAFWGSCGAGTFPSYSRGALFGSRRRSLFGTRGGRFFGRFAGCSLWGTGAAVCFFEKPNLFSQGYYISPRGDIHLLQNILDDFFHVLFQFPLGTIVALFKVF